MYDYAKANGFITDEDRYLETITERQDISLNMTKMSDEEIMKEIKIGAAKLNKMLGLSLTDETYIKTRTVQSGQIKIKRKVLDPKKLERLANDVSFNYAQTEFKFNSME